MTPAIIVAAGYLGLHLVAYLLVLRNVPAFTSERVIFLYHFVSAILVSAVAILLGWLGGSSDAWGSAIAIIALHGIYSVTFLEVWSLAEGSYSLQILTYLRRLERHQASFDQTILWQVGAAKQGNRVDGLIKLGLVRRQRDLLVLTGSGRAIGAALTAIAWLANVRDEAS